MAAELMETSFHQQWLEYRDSRELFEWACSRIRRLDPSEFEKWFHLVGLALMQGAGDESLLSGTRNYRYYRTALPIPGGESHPKHAGLRFPLEPRFRLAYVTTALETQFLATWPLPPAYLTNDMAGRFEIERGGSAAQTADTLKALASLFGDPSVSHEARLRSGVLRFLRGEVDESKTQLAQAVSSEDRTLRYIAYLMLGAIADRENRLPEALEHYRRAYETVAASASSIALASALYRTGRETEAADVIEKFNQREPQADPWRLYGQRDYRFLSEYRANMRNALLRLR
jgi:tetratricopeptide (TPR) repeat protein